MDGQRVKFKKGEQRIFFNKVIEKLNCFSLRKLSDYDLDIPYSTLKKYYSEYYLLPFPLFKKLCSLSKIKKNSLNISYLPGNWGAVKGGKKGIVSMMKKYSSQLPLWRIRGGMNSPIPKTKDITYPELNENLAEFIGAYLGDGTLTKYFIRISGDYRYDLPYFNYLSKLIFKLFGIKPIIIKEKRLVNTAHLLIFSKKICSFLKDDYGIKYGHKIRNKTCVPKDILKDKELSIACLRGLVDTDGSVSRRGKGGSQFCVQFTNHNKKLLYQANSIGKRLRIFTYITGNGTGTNKWENILKYFEIVGSSNLRHIVRFCLRNYESKTIYVGDVVKYYKKNLYRNINLPFKMGLWSSG